MGFVDKATYKNAKAILLKSGWVATFLVGFKMVSLRPSKGWGLQIADSDPYPT